MDSDQTAHVLDEVAAERDTQRELWGNDHDDRHGQDGELIMYARYRAHHAWSTSTPRDKARRLLVQAAALLVAEVERLDREAARR